MELPFRRPRSLPKKLTFNFCFIKGEKFRIVYCNKKSYLFFFIFQILRKTAVRRGRPLLMIFPVTNYRKHNQAFPLFLDSLLQPIASQEEETKLVFSRTAYVFLIYWTAVSRRVGSFCWGRETTDMQLPWLPRAKSFFLISKQIILSLADSPRPMHII